VLPVASAILEQFLQHIYEEAVFVDVDDEDRVGKVELVHDSGDPVIDGFLMSFEDARPSSLLLGRS
jgi:hypothetical protein